MAIQGPASNHEQIKAWAESRSIIPVNVEPNRIDAEPAAMCLLRKDSAMTTSFVKEMTWSDFFARFDELRLTLVYDDVTAYNEILQVDDDLQPLPYKTITSHH